MSSVISVLNRLRPLAIATVFAIGGAVIASWLGMPAAALVGSAIGVTIAAFARLGPGVPDRLRDIGFAVIGVTLGAGVTPSFLSDLMRWPASLLALAVTMGLIIFVSGAILRRYFAADRETAILATSPGALSVALALSAGGMGDARYVMVLQSLRLLLITVCLPPLIGYAGPAADVAADGAYDPISLSIMETALIIAGAAAVGFGLQRINAPAAWLLGGLLVSGIAHGAGFVVGRPPVEMMFFGFAIAGAVIGARFAGVSFAELRRLALAGIVATIVAVAIAALASLLVASLSGLPFALIWIAFAPGGVEGMAAMALALGYDPVFVATHHIFRILLLIAVLPLCLRYWP